MKRLTNLITGRALLIVVLGLLIVFPFGCSKKDAQNKEIKIGAILPLTGDYANLGESCKRGIELAVMRINNSGGVCDRKALRVIYEDSAGRSVDAISGLNKLINIDQVPAIIGELASSITLAIAPIANKAEVVLLSPTASSPKVSHAGDYVFRVCASDIFEGTAMAEFAYNDLSYRYIAVLYVNNDYGLGLSDAFQKRFTELGGKINISQSFEEKSTDFRTQLIKIKASNIQAVYMPGYALEMGLILKQAKELGLSSHFLSSIDFENPQVITVAGNAAEGVIYTAYRYNSKSDLPQIKDFVEEFKRIYETEPDIYAALSYDATCVLAKGMDKAPVNSRKIKDSLYQIEKFPGVTGDISFDANGDVTQAITIKIYREGSFEYY